MLALTGFSVEWYSKPPILFAIQCFIIVACTDENMLPMLVMAGHILDVCGVSVYS